MRIEFSWFYSEGHVSYSLQYTLSSKTDKSHYHSKHTNKKFYDNFFNFFLVEFFKLFKDQGSGFSRMETRKLTAGSLRIHEI